VSRDGGEGRLRADLYWLRPGRALPQQELQRRLGPGERARCAGLAHPEAARHFALGRALLRAALAEATGRSAREWCFGRLPGGRPAAAGSHSPEAPRFSLSHTPGLVVCLVCPGAQTGVDVECEDRTVPALPLARRFFAPHEAAWLAELPDPARRRRFLELWVLKEAVLKALGVGLRGGLSKVAISGLEGGDPRRVALGAGERRPGPQAPPEWTLRTLRVAPRHRLGVAVHTQGRELELVVRAAPRRFGITVEG